MISRRVFNSRITKIADVFSQITGKQLDIESEDAMICAKIAFAVAGISGVDSVIAAGVALAARDLQYNPTKHGYLRILKYCTEHSWFSKGARRKSDFVSYLLDPSLTTDPTWEAFNARAEYAQRELMLAFVTGADDSQIHSKTLSQCEEYIHLAQHALQIICDISMESRMYLNIPYLAQSSYSLVLLDMGKIGSTEVFSGLREQDLINMVESQIVRSKCIDHVLTICSHLEAKVLSMQELEDSPETSAMSFMLIALSDYVRSKLQGVFI